MRLLDPEDREEDSAPRHEGGCESATCVEVEGEGATSVDEAATSVVSCNN